MTYRYALGPRVYRFETLAALMAAASPARSGDALAGLAACSAEERVAAQLCLADLPLSRFLDEELIPSERDEVSRLTREALIAEAFRPVSSLTVGEFREWLLSCADPAALKALAPGLMPEMVAAVSKIMRNQDLILVSSRVRVETAFRNHLGGRGCLHTRLQPNHPLDDPRGVAASIIDGLCYASGDAVIGINPSSDNAQVLTRLLHLLDDIIATHRIPTQACVLTHVTNTMKAMEAGVPVDLVFQSIGGTQGTNDSFGVNASLLSEAREAALAQGRGSCGNNVMYFETGQGSALSAGAHGGVDQQTVEARAYGFARLFDPLLVNTVVGFIGPEYLYDGKEIIRAGLEDHFCGKLLGLPMGMDICYTNHSEADQNDMDVLLTLMGAAGCNFIMGVPGADDIMLNYQSTSFHDALYLRDLLGLRPAPEFEVWLRDMEILDPRGALCSGGGRLGRDPQGGLLGADLPGGRLLSSPEAPRG